MSIERNEEDINKALEDINIKALLWETNWLLREILLHLQGEDKSELRNDEDE